MSRLINIFTKKPLIVVFEVTKYCNEKCPMCSIPIREPHEEMNLEQIRIVFRKLKRIGVREVLLQGGEPLLRKDIFEIMTMLKGMGFSPVLVTNGLLLNEKVYTFSQKNDIRMSISLDSLVPEKYKKIRGVGALPKLLENLSMAKNFKHKRPWSLHCTVSNLNVDEVFDIKIFSKKNGFVFSSLPYIYGIGPSGTKNDDMVYDKEKLMAVFTKLSKEESDFFISHLLREAVRFLSGEDIGRCDALRYTIKLDELGRVSPCLEMPPYISLLEKEPEDIFQDVQMKKVECCSRNTPCFYGCTRGFSSMLRNKKEIITHPLKSARSFKGYI